MRRIMLCLVLLAFLFSPLQTAQSAAMPPQPDALPDYFDWREAGVVTAVRQQGACGGAARAFAATAMLESAILIAGGPRVDLSEQYLLNCNDRGVSCQNPGGWDVLDFYRDAFLAPNTQAGAVLESALPYRAKAAACTRVSKHPYQIERWGTLSAGRASVEEIQRALLAYGPVAIGVCAWNHFAQYSGGVFETDESTFCMAQGAPVNHVVMVVGWDDPGGFWIVKNSWGKDWGVDGYMLLRYNVSNAGYDSAYLVYAAPPPIPALAAPSSGALLPPNGVELRWKAAGGASAYRVQIASDAAFDALVSEDETPALALAPAALPSNAALWWRVSACRTVDGLPRCSAWSSPRSLKTRPQTPLPESPGGGARVDSLRPALRWSQPDDAARFDVQFATDADFRKGLRSASVSAPGYTPGSDLPRARALFWRVRARGRYGTGAWSAAQPFVTPDPPAAPRLLAPTSGALLNAGEQPLLRWSVSAGEVAGYRVQLAHSQSFGEIVESAEGPQTTHALTVPLAPNAVTYWRVRAVGPDGALSNWSTPRSIKTRPDAPLLLQPEPGALVDSLRPWFTWQGGVTRYEIQIARDAGCAKVLRSASVTGAQYRPSSNLPGGAGLFWRVRARGSYGMSAWSACQAFQTPP